MMAEINNNLYGVGDILRKWQELVGGEEEDKTSVSKRFQYILKNKLKLSKTEISWFKEKKENQIDRFVFQADEIAHLYLNDIMYICGKRSAALTPSEEQKLIDCFAAILPYPVHESTERNCWEVFNQRACKIEQAVHNYYFSTQDDRLYGNKLFVKKCTESKLDKGKRKEFYRDQYRLVKGWRDKWVFVMKKAGEIRKAERVESLYWINSDYKDRITPEDEEKFCETGKSENEILQGAYRKMTRICSKDLCQYALWLFITEDLKIKGNEEERADKAREEGVGEMTACIEICIPLFREVIAHQLKTISMEDFEYLERKAVEELETISIILHQSDKAQERRKKSLYPEVEILEKTNKKKEPLALRLERQKCRERLLKLQYCTEEGLQNLSKIRKYLNEKENETILILHYI